MKKLLSLLLGLCLGLLLAVPAFAATPGLEHFHKNHHYEHGHFSDVTDSHWAHRTITTAYEYGFMDGKGIQFDPEADITLAETLVLAARIHDISYGGTGVFDQSGAQWYDAYLFYCEEYEIIAPDNGYWERPDAAAMGTAVTRDEFCAIMYNAVKDFIFDTIDEPLYVRFEDADSINHAEQVYDLAQCAIIGGVQGADELMYFQPHKAITRAEAATIISRIVDLDLRIMPIN